MHLGFNASQEYVLDQLQPLDHFLNVTVQPFTFTQTLAVAPPHFRQVRCTSALVSLYFLMSLSLHAL